MLRSVSMASASFALAILASMSGAMAQTAPVPLASYADDKGWIDVQKLTCGQLAGTFQEDADMLTAWYSGWYNGLAKKHAINVQRSKDVEHELIMYCKANPTQKIIEGIAVVFKDERAKLGIEMK